jgi:hypothetical protein
MARYKEKHYSTDPNKLKKAVNKSRESILARYGDTGFSELRKQVTSHWYANEKQNIQNAELLSKQDTHNFFVTVGLDKYKGKAGSRKLKKENIRIYKSLNHYCSEFKTYNNDIEVPFLGKIQIAIWNFTIPADMLCYCGKRLKFEPRTQQWSKLYCNVCRKTGTSKQHFKLKYGDEWESIWQARKINGNNGAIMRGRNEETILNEVEEKNKISIDRNFRLLNFYPDGYCKETNTIYEIYEQYHKSDKYLKRDDIRRRIIQNYLKCDFVIIWDNKDRTTEFYKYV